MTKVMIIEDDPMVLAINKKFLSKIEGFRFVTEAISLSEAKDKIIHYNPDLILLDVFFPLGKGTDLLKWLRSNEMAIDVILITADKSSDTVTEAFRYGAIDYLIKPFKFERFQEALLSYKAMKSKLKPSEPVNQELIDALTNHDSNIITSDEDEIYLMDEYKNPTFLRIIDYINDHPNSSFTSQSIAKALGISRITARRYLDELEKNKVLDLELEYGTVGRPRNIYYLKKK